MCGETDRSWGHHLPPSLGNRMTKACAGTVTRVGGKPVGKVTLDRAGLGFFSVRARQKIL